MGLVGETIPMYYTALKSIKRKFLARYITVYIYLLLGIKVTRQ